MYMGFAMAITRLFSAEPEKRKMRNKAEGRKRNRYPKAL